MYNIPKQSAVDIIAGNTCRFAGDSIVLKDAFVKNFNLKTSHIKSRVFERKDVVLPNIKNYVLKISASKILILGSNELINGSTKKIKLNALILSRNSNQSPAEINNLFDCDYIIADSSVPVWKSAKWKKEFEQLHLRFHSVAQDGAFTLKL